MKGLGLALASALALAIPLAAQADPHDHGQGRGGRFEAGPGGRTVGPPPGWRGEPQGPAHEERPPWRGGPGPHEERFGGEGWDDRRFNGYWLGSRWFYGPPPGEAEAEPSFRPGFAPWRRGGFLPPYYQSQVVDEYWRFHLRRPPFGYHWIQVGADFMLVSVSTGLIFDIIPAD